MVAGILQGALVDVQLAGAALITRGGAVTLETIDQVCAGSTILTRRGLTLVNLSLTILSSVAWQTPTLSALNTIIVRMGTLNIIPASPLRILDYHKKVETSLRQMSVLR